MRALIITMGLMGWWAIANAQQPTQTLRGKVLDAVNQQALVGATIELSGKKVGETTDEEGRFRWEGLAVGRYELKIQYLGYRDLMITEVLLESGKETVLNIEMQPQVATIETVEVTTSRRGQEVSHPLSVKTMTVEQVLRFPATYYDPARVATSYAGVLNNNDQSNGLSIRGHSPDFMSWQLDGLAILNPNHTPNAGTLSDQTALNSGGVNILSAQLLSTTRLYTGAFPTQYGNALSGVMDMSLRHGNNEQHEFTAQAGLIGLDVAAEGPFKKGGRSSFLANYRYSTVGLLTQMGVDFGEESINFQDLSFNLVFPGRKGQQLTIYGFGGLSVNEFEGKIDPAERESDRDLFNVDFESATGSAGVTWKQPVGQSGLFYAGVGASVVDQQREQIPLEDSLKATIPATILWDANTLSLYTAHTYYRQQLANKNSHVTVGAQVKNYDFTRDDSKLPAEITLPTTDFMVLQPYLNWASSIGEKLSYQLGLQYSYYDTESTYSYLEPRALLAFQLSEKQKISLAYGLHSQALSPYNTTFNAANEPIRAHHMVLGYQQRIKPGLEFSAEAYYHHLFNIPTGYNLDGSLVTALDIINNYQELNQLYFEGNETVTGANYGLELSLQQYFAQNFYYIANATFYTATVDERATAYDGQYIANATLGKEWQKAKSDDKIKTWGANLRIVYAGGLKEGAINTEISQLANYTIYSSFATEQLPDFFRSDVRVYLKRSRPNYSTTIALDIQNLTNQENIGYHYYDILKQEVSERYQISLIPILTYRLEF